MNKFIVKGRNITLSERDMEKLQDVKDKEQIQSKSEAVRRAIDFFWRETCGKET